MASLIDISEEVAAAAHGSGGSALAGGDPRGGASGVVALESTIIAHGMPYPQNLETARLLEQT
ncbi:MAG: pseudouridine-5'-phosphate glycosidase, partial [Spirochaetota bacterium]